MHHLGPAQLSTSPPPGGLNPRYDYVDEASSQADQIQSLGDAEWVRHNLSYLLPSMYCYLAFS